MLTRFFITALLSVFSCAVMAQPIIYKDASTLITGVWQSAGSGGTVTLQEVTSNGPYEGTKHYRMDYNYNSWWAGIGLNLTNWGATPAKNFSGYTHLRVAYKGLSGAQTLSVALRNGNVFGNTVLVGSANPNYDIADISIASLVNGTSLNANSVSELNFSIGGVQVGSGTVFIDNIELVNISPGGGAASSAANWARSQSLGRGVNCSNWLEAFWLMPSNFPEPGRYTRAKILALRNAGFQSFRLPITFERMFPNAPYTINFNTPALQLVDSMIVWANTFDFKLIIDNHHGHPDLSNSNYLTEIPRLQALWAQIAQRYGNLDPNRFFFEISNEATPAISNNNFRIVATQVLATIRANESVRHSVIVGASGWNSGQELVNFTPLNDADVIYTFHSYDPYFFTHQQMSWTSPPYMPARAFPLAGEVNAINSVFADVKSWSTTNNVPVFLGEYGVSTGADAVSRCNYIQTLTAAINANNFPHFYWDAITPNDAFGFYSSSTNIAQSTVVPCFATAMGLYSAPLSVELTHFDADCSGGSIALEWLAHSLERGNTCVIQGSTDAVVWQTLTGSFDISSGEKMHWEESHTPMQYYRLKMVSIDGKVTYSNVRTSPCADETEPRIWPNPTRGDVTIGNVQSDMQVVVVDMMGRAVTETIIGYRNEEIQLPLDQLPSGQYYVKYTKPQGFVGMLPLSIVK